MKGFTSKDGRGVVVGQKVAVYRNLHKDCWSIYGIKEKKVLGYAERVTLRGLDKPKRKRDRTTFHVVESGRLRVLKEQKKNVHAHIVGYLEGCEFVELESTIYYNPYKVSSFVNVADGSAVYHADLISLDISNGVVSASNAREEY